MQAGIEGLGARPEGLQHERRSRLRGRDELLGAEDDERRLRRLARRAVHECEGLAALEGQRGQPGGGEGLARGTALPSPLDLALSQERQSDVRELDQVAARPDRPGLGHDRMDGRVQHRDERFHDDRPHRGAPLRERERARGHGGAHDGLRMRGPEAGGVAAHEIPLEAARRGPGHRAVAERPAAGIEPVHGPSRAE